MKSIFYLVACSFCAACCLFAETIEQQPVAESIETVACIKCNRPACGGCGKLACSKCKNLTLIEATPLVNAVSQEQDSTDLAGCPCKGKGRKTAVEALFNQTQESILA